MYFWNVYRSRCTSILLQYEVHRVADCRHRALWVQQDDAHLLQSLVIAVQRLEDLWYQLHIWAECAWGLLRTRIIKSKTNIFSMLKVYLQCLYFFIVKYRAWRHLLQLLHCQLCNTRFIVSLMTTVAEMQQPSAYYIYIQLRMSSIDWF